MVSIQPIVTTRYETLVLPPPAQLHVFLDGYLNNLPRFIGETRPTIEDHLAIFVEFVENMNIEYEYVYKRLFLQSLEGNLRIWFRQIQDNSIKSWVELTKIFRNQWGNKKDIVYYLT